MGGSKELIENLYKENREFTIIALTGRVRAGTSDIAELLKSESFPDKATQPADTSGFSMSEVREHKVIYRYLHHHWKPFVELNVTSVIVSFILELSEEELRRETIRGKKREISLYDFLECCFKKTVDLNKNVSRRISQIDKSIRFHGNENSYMSIQRLGECEKILESITGISAFKNIWESVYKDKKLKYTKEAFVLCYGVLPYLSECFEEELGKNLEFTVTFQNYGNNIRAYGRALSATSKDVSPLASEVFSMPERLNQFIKILRHYKTVAEAESSITSNPIFVVINNLKNIFESFYFRRRYSSFYLIAVSCDEKKRQAQFDTVEKYRLTDLNENLSSGKKVFKQAQELLNKNQYTKEKFEEKEKDIKRELGIDDAAVSFIKSVFWGDQLRKECYEKKMASFILQDVTTCIENADIFLTRDYNEMDCNADYPLIRALARIITLILHPGLLTPTKIERCMQIAMTAKLNSGCLSRQVGAVVTDNEYNILSLGWNDTPCGQESCIRRNLFDLLRKHDPEAYSEYELNDEGFRRFLDIVEKKLGGEEKKQGLRGLPFAFCFKDIYQDIIKQRDQIYTRALHGEERALISCGNERTKGGFLFTTSSPCELCAKKIKEAQIKKIYYIEQYPGISRPHIINAGVVSMRAKYELFVGAVGHAYVKLYTPHMPYKDELTALGYSPAAVYSSYIEDEEEILPSSKKQEIDITKTSMCENSIQIQQMN